MLTHRTSDTSESLTDLCPKLLSQLQLWRQRDGVMFKLLQQVGFTDAFDSNGPKFSAKSNDVCVSSSMQQEPEIRVSVHLPTE